MPRPPFVPLGVILALVLALPACRAQRTLEYSAAIDPAFTPDQMEEITAAVDEWKTSVPELRITSSIAACGSASAQQVCVHPVHAPPYPADEVVGTTHMGTRDSATVLIYVDRIQATGMDVHILTKRTATHELGHAMGLRHSNAGTLMAAYVSEQAQTVTDADVDQFWAVDSR